MDTIEIKAFVPAKDFELSKRFYQDLGFTVEWSSEETACLRAGPSSFLLQRFYVKEHADNFMMHLLVQNVDAWWAHVEKKELASERQSERFVSGQYWRLDGQSHGSRRLLRANRVERRALNGT